MATLLELLTTKPAEFRYNDGRLWVVSTRPLAVALAVGYCAAVLGGQRLMRPRAPLELRAALVAWNAALAVFSVLGAWATVPEMVGLVAGRGLTASWCRLHGYFEGRVGFWAFAFLVSKVAELGDTAFLVLRKRPVIFLHWYHHATVLLWMWVAYPTDSAAMRWGIGMNYAVHSVMYVYFALRAGGVALPRALAQAITSLQMLQFVVAIAITADVLLKLFSGSGDCENSRAVIVGQSFLYATYLALFARFFANAYRRPKPKAS